MLYPARNSIDGGEQSGLPVIGPEQGDPGEVIDTSGEQLRQHLADFVSAYNFARRLKTPKGLTPYEFICKTWLKEPKRFSLDRSIKCRD